MISHVILCVPGFGGYEGGVDTLPVPLYSVHIIVEISKLHISLNTDDVVPPKIHNVLEESIQLTAPYRAADTRLKLEARFLPGMQSLQQAVYFPGSDIFCDPDIQAQPFPRENIHRSFLASDASTVTRS